MPTNSTFDKVLVMTPIVLMVVLLNSDFSLHLDFKVDSFILVIGNFFIALYIGYVINKRHKNEELKINNCFTELDYLLELFSSLRSGILNNDETLDDLITRYTSLILLEIELIKKYSFINPKHKEKLSSQYYALDQNLTDGNEINTDYKVSLLQLERTVLNIKSDIL